jgi:hypothetical protein
MRTLCRSIAQSDRQTLRWEPLLAIAASLRRDPGRRRYHLVTSSGGGRKCAMEEVTLAGGLLPQGPRVAQA